MLCSKCNQSFDSLMDEGLCSDCYAEADDRRLEIVELARNEHQKDGEAEIDDNAQLSEGNDNGCYVQAWVWVGFSGTHDHGRGPLRQVDDGAGGRAGWKAGRRCFAQSGQRPLVFQPDEGRP